MYPEYKSVFKAFNLCNYANVSVVILGYDPYFDGSATGLSFDSAKNCNTLSPALKVIKNSFQSYEDWEELGNFEPDLEKWAKHIDDLKNREQELISNLFCNEFQPLSDFNRQNELVAELKALGFDGYTTNNEIAIF